MHVTRAWYASRLFASSRGHAMPISRRSFYWQWFWRSFWNPIGYAQAFGFLLAAAFGIWGYFRPDMLGTLTPLLWIIPTVFFVAVFVIGWLTAPYVMYRELEVKSASTEAALANALRGEVTPEERT